MRYHCCDPARRNALRGHPSLNGIDFLEVVDNPADPLPLRQTRLLVRLINDFPVASLPQLLAAISGGERVRTIRVVSLTMPDPADARLLQVTVDQAGDFSTYTLTLATNPNVPGAPLPLDPLLAQIDFSFKVGCPSDFDCQPVAAPPAAPAPGPVTTYLAKDYATFRQLMLDRMALLAPDWTERNPADAGIAVVELLAYVGDYLSYQQDATATEAYLHTARLRTSVRRHARLVDYTMHDGCNARVWVQVQLMPGMPPLTLNTNENGLRTQFLTKARSVPQPAHLTFAALDYQRVMNAGVEVFEPLHPIDLAAEHNEMAFYTWGNGDCCLPAGAMSATLVGHFPDLQPGHVLIFAEVRGPKTGLPGDADPTRRHAVRLTTVTPTVDPLGLPTNPPTPIPPGVVANVTTIHWHPDDALPFGLCLSARQGTVSIADVSMAFGNIVLADHGQTLFDQPVTPTTVPTSTLTYPATAKHCDDVPARPIPPRYRPRLGVGPLTFAAPFESTAPPTSAHADMQWSMQVPLPQLHLTGQHNATQTQWEPHRELLNSLPTDTHVVVETETDGATYLRFGNDIQGARPTSGTSFTATYRVGNGPSGNVGADALVSVVTDVLTPGAVLNVRNWLPATGGTAPETLSEVRQKAPYAFRQQERAVTSADYERLARQADPTVQRTACTYRWTGSWRTAFLSVDRLGNQPVDTPFEEQLRARMERYRLAGYDLEVDGPRPVSLELTMDVCVQRGYFAADVKAALLAVFTRHYQPNGQPGLFHPDRFTFGQTVYLSPFYAAAQAIPGVSSVLITAFRRQGSDDTTALDNGAISLGRLEIARLDNDPNFPDRGRFSLTMNA